MTQYISKDAVVAEIVKIRKSLNLNLKHDQGVCDGLYAIQKYINSLEVKEADLEKHLKEDIEDVFFDLNGVAVKGSTHYLTVEDVKDIAKHFYELGMAAANKA